MTVGVLTTSFPRYPGDFAGCFVEDTVRDLAAAGHAVDVLAASDPSCTGRARDQPLASTSAHLVPGVRVWHVPMPSVPAGQRLFFGEGAPETLENGGPGVWTQAICFWAGLCERLRERARFWERIVAHWLVPSALAARAVAPDLPLTAHAHSGDIALLERLPAGAALARRLISATSDLVFVSDDLRNRFGRLTGIASGRVARLSVARTGTHSAQREPGAMRAVSPPPSTDRPMILSVGRLVPIKGFDVLVRAVALAAAARPGRHFPAAVTILGEGPERRHLETLARRLDVDLRLPGILPRPTINDWMSRARLYVQPSRPLSSGRTEGTPVATLEALAAGLPVVASASGGLRELPGVRLVAPNHPAALAACLNQFV